MAASFRWMLGRVTAASSVQYRLSTRTQRKTIGFIAIYDMLYLRAQEAAPLAGGRVAALQARPRALLECTSVTLDECQQLVSPCEAAFQAPLATGRRDGQPRTARQVTVSENCPCRRRTTGSASCSPP